MRRNHLTRWLTARRRTGLRASGIVIALAVAVAAQSNAPLTVEQVEAAFLYNFTKYTEWHTAPDAAPDTVHICVFGSAQVADELDKSVEGKLSGTRVVHIRRLSAADSLSGCEVAFAGGAAKSVQRLVAAAAAYPVLTVGDSNDFMASGGMVRFVAEENRVRFDINVAAAAKANIRFDSRLLALARSRIEVAQ